MADFIPLADISQLTVEERDFLLNRCGVREGYYDQENNDFVIRKMR